MTTSAQIEAGVIGACYYLPPVEFERRATALCASILGARPALRRFVAMQSDNVPSTTPWSGPAGSFLDISAYATAAATLPSGLPLYAVFNDTVFTRHPARLVGSRLAALVDSLATMPVPAAAGEVHPTTDVLLHDLHNPSRRHLSTFCIVLNARGFDVMRELLGTLPDGGSRQAIAHWLEDRMQAHPALRALLHVHLHGPATPWSWTGLAQATADPPTELVARKAVTVVFEYLLTARLLVTGAVLPINHSLGYRLRARMGRHG